MTGLVSSLITATGPVVLEAFLFYALKTSVVLVLAIMAVSLMQKSAPLKRNLVLRTAMIAVLVMPLLSIGGPSWHVGVVNPVISALQVGGTTLSPADANAAVLGETAGVSWIGLAVLVWVIGAAVVVLRLLVGTAMSIVIVRRARPAGPGLNRLAERLAEETKMNRSVTLFISKSISMPFAAGVFRSIIVLPEGAEQWTSEYARMVLLHELAHTKRHDVVWAIIGSLVAAVHWFNPLVWIVRKNLLMEAEKTCDDYVISAGTGQASYAEHLLSVARDMGGFRLIYPLGAGMARKTQLEGRLMSVLSKRVHSAGTGRRLAAVVLTLAAAIVIPLACLNVTAYAGDNAAKVTSNEKTKSTTDSLPSSDDFVAVDEYPEMILNVKPDYPKSLQDKGMEGKVYIQALVDKKGKVRKVKVSKSSGHTELDDLAMKAAFKNEYKPGMVDGKPVAVWVTYYVEFSLSTKSNK